MTGIGWFVKIGNLYICLHKINSPVLIQGYIETRTCVRGGINEKSATKNERVQSKRWNIHIYLCMNVLSISHEFCFSVLKYNNIIHNRLFITRLHVNLFLNLTGSQKSWKMRCKIIAQDNKWHSAVVFFFPACNWEKCLFDLQNTFNIWRFPCLFNGFDILLARKTLQEKM